MSILWNGLTALVIAFLLGFVSDIVLAILNIPLSVILPDNAHQSTMQVLEFLLSFQVIFTVVFICEMLDNLGIPNVKTYFKKRLERKKSEVQKPA